MKIIGSRKRVAVLALTADRLTKLMEAHSRQDQPPSFVLGPYLFREEDAEGAPLPAGGPAIGLSPIAQLLGPFAHLCFSHRGIARFFRLRDGRASEVQVCLTRTDEGFIRLEADSRAPGRFAGAVEAFEPEPDETTDRDDRVTPVGQEFLRFTVPLLMGRTRVLRDMRGTPGYERLTWSQLTRPYAGYEFAPGCWLHAPPDHFDAGCLLIDTARFEARDKGHDRYVHHEGYAQVRLPDPSDGQMSWVALLESGAEGTPELLLRLNALVRDKATGEPIACAEPVMFSWEWYANP